MVTSTALAVQAGYAVANGLNLLAAGLSNVPNATTGSGIHYFNGTSVASVSSVSTSLALNASVMDLSVRSFPSVCSQVNSFKSWSLYSTLKQSKFYTLHLTKLIK